MKNMGLDYPLLYIYGLVKERRNSTANALLRLSCTNPSKCDWGVIINI